MKKIFLTLCIALTAATATAQIENGIYRQMKYQLGNSPEQPCPYDEYKIFIDNKLWHIDVQNQEPYNFVLKRLVGESIVSSTNTSFTTEWICDIKDHKTIPYGETVLEFYDKNIELNPLMIEMCRLFQPQENYKGKMERSWKMCTRKVEIHKVYGEKHLLYFVVSRNDEGNISSIRGSVQPFTYSSRTKTIENGTKCDIIGTESDMIIVSYDLNGEQMAEIWKPCPVPAEISTLFQTLKIGN